MATQERQKQTTINVSEKATLIWDIATHLYGEYKPHEYGRVILPMTVIKRFDDCLKTTKDNVLKIYKTVEDKAAGTRDAVLKDASGYAFYNISKFDLEKLLSDADNIAANFADYLAGFSDNVKDVISYFEFDKEIAKMSQNDLLYTIIQEFNSKKADMSPDKVTSQDMGYIFEELVRRFSESYDEQAGAHFTARDIIYLMSELLIAPEKDLIKDKAVNKTAYDMTMGTSQMLACLDERLKDINPKINLICHGQEFNPETYAIAKADMLIKGGNAENMKFGDTLSNDQFCDFTFDYIISNPPFGIDWKKEKESVLNESKLGFDGRFGICIPSISDGQTLFVQNGLKKLKDNGRMAIIQNASTLYAGSAGKGVNLLRKYLLENDLIEAIVELPENIFYNTPINTYIWVISKTKDEKRKGKIQLIDASKCFIKRRKNIGEKKNDLDDKCISLILNAYNSFKTDSFEYKFKSYDKYYDLFVGSKVFDNSYFGYTEITIQFPKIVNGIVQKKKDTVIVDNSKSFCIDLPFNEDIEKYLKTYVYKDFSDAIYNKQLNVVGYEIPFVRLFHTLEKIRPSEEIFNELKDLQSKKIEDTLREPVQTTKSKKNTYIKYIPQIPEDWNVTYTRNLFDISNEKAKQNNPTVLTLARSGVKVRDISTNEGQLAESYEDYNPVQKMDLLLNPMDLISGDNCSISYTEGVISPAYINLRPKANVNSEFYNYYFKYQYWIMAMFEQGKGVSFDNRWTMNKDACLSYMVPNISFELQTKIANQIKNETEKIDELIRIEELKIEKLKELKKSIISEMIIGEKEVK